MHVNVNLHKRNHRCILMHIISQMRKTRPFYLHSMSPEPMYAFRVCLNPLCTYSESALCARTCIWQL